MHDPDNDPGLMLFRGFQGFLGVLGDFQGIQGISGNANIEAFKSRVKFVAVYKILWLVVYSVLDHSVRPISVLGYGRRLLSR